jgi:hypothetical protein
MWRRRRRPHGAPMDCAEMGRALHVHTHESRAPVGGMAPPPARARSWPLFIIRQYLLGSISRRRRQCITRARAFVRPVCVCLCCQFISRHVGAQMRWAMASFSLKSRAAASVAARYQEDEHHIIRRETSRLLQSWPQACEHGPPPPSRAN